MRAAISSFKKSLACSKVSVDSGQNQSCAKSFESVDTLISLSLFNFYFSVLIIQASPNRPVTQSVHHTCTRAGRNEELTFIFRCRNLFLLVPFFADCNQLLFAECSESIFAFRNSSSDSSSSSSSGCSSSGCTCCSFGSQQCG